MKYLLAALGPIALDVVSEVVVLNQHDIKCFGWHPCYTPAIGMSKKAPALLVDHILPVVTAGVKHFMWETGGVLPAEVMAA